MKTLILLLVIGTAIATKPDYFNPKEVAMKWAKHKAMESCFGTEMMKNYMIKTKRAVQKCVGVEAPELNLPFFRSPSRVVYALLNQLEEKQEDQLIKLMAGTHMMKQQQQQPIQLVVGGQPSSERPNDFFKMMMMKYFMKHAGGGGKFNDYDVIEEMHKYTGDKKRPPFDNMDSTDNMKMEMFKKMLSNKRYRRDVSDELQITQNKLTEKLLMEQQEVQQALGNMSCILQEMHMVNKNNDVDINAIEQAIDNEEWGPWKDQWVKDHHKQDCRDCYAIAEAAPRSVLEKCPMGVKWGKIKMFVHCEKMAKWRMCMNHDIKQKLEKHFGNLDELTSATGLPEEALLPLAMKTLYDQMDMFD